jgi:polyisoprenyl-teichoic acid--peptidoglycan teichoic acid transferase
VSPTPTLTPGDDRRTGATVPLPASGSGSRRSQRTSGRIDRRRRRRQTVALVVKGVAAAVVVALLVGGAATLVVPAAQRLLDGRASASGSAGDAGDAEGAAVGSTRTVVPAPAGGALIAHESDSGRLVGVTVVAATTTGNGGNVLFVPVGSMVEVPSFGLQPLRAAYRDGGMELLRSSIENLLGIQFEAATVVDAAAIEAMVAPAGRLTVDVPHAVEVVDGPGRVEVVFSRGPNEIGPDEVGQLLAEPGGVSELDRLVRHEAFWRSWLAAVAVDVEGARPAAGAVGDAVVALTGGPVEYHLLPVEAVAGGSTGDDGLYRVRQADLDRLVAKLAPASSSSAERIRVQVLNGTGQPGVSQLVHPELVRAGATVTLTGNADHFAYDATQIVYYRDDQLPAARAVRDALGVGEVVKSLTGMIVVDVTVVVGQDFAQVRPDDRVEGARGGAVAEGEGA